MNGCLDVRNLTKADKARGVKIQDLGCLVCLEFLKVFTPCGIHHLDGQTKEGCHQLTIGLCSNHHQIPSNTGEWICRHSAGKYSGKALFEETYRPESELLQLTNEMIGE